MTDSNVIQGRLGWESGDVSEANVSELQSHPKNREIYGDTRPDDLDEAFLESVAEKGVLEPLVITRGKQIISGHRRWAAAKASGIETAPVRYCEFDSELAEREALVEFNRQREKTDAQLVREFEEIVEIERQRAEERQRELGKNQGRDPSGNVSERGEARDKAAEKVNADVSGRTLEKGLTVKEKADGGDETAQQEWERLESGDQTLSGAYDAIQQDKREAREEREREANREQRLAAFNNAAETIDVIHSDFREADIEAESIDHIVTDPPYGEDHLGVWRDLSQFAARVLKPGGFCITYSGKYHLPAVFDGLSRELEYYWQTIVVHDGPGAKFFARKLRTGYKPILVYAKPPLDQQEDFVTDVLEGGGREKDDHDWQQAEAEAAALLERFTNVNDRICDPMAGSGTTAIACHRLNRQCVAIDEDPAAIDAIEQRWGE